MLPINPAKIPDLYQEALGLQNAGQADAAAARYRRILEANPKVAEAHYQLGRIALAAGAAQEAAAHLERALKLKPKEPAVWQSLAEAVSRLEDPERNRALLTRAKAARLPAPVVAKLRETLRRPQDRTRTSVGTADPREVRRAIGLIDKGAFAEADRLAARLSTAHPDVAVIHDIRAVAAAALGKAETAETCWKRSIALDPNYAEARAKYGRFLLERGDWSGAVGQLQPALKLAPKLPDALTAMGLALEQVLKFEKAADMLRRSLEAKPGQWDARAALARCLNQTKSFEEALEVLRPRLAEGATDTGTVSAAASALVSLDRADEAVDVFDRALAARPGAPDLLSGKGHLLQRLGRLAEAEDLLRQAIDASPRDTQVYRMLVGGTKLTPDDPLIEQMEALFADPSIGDRDRANLGFALAKAMEDAKAHDRVFTYLRPANDAMRRLFPYDIAEREAYFARVKKTFRQQDFSRSLSGAPAFDPIFVTGLPRSGTTLVEQILASHSTVTGGGELGLARRELSTILLPKEGEGRALDSLSDREIAEAGDRIEAGMRRLYPGADRITDKGVQTYHLIGPIRMALPRARFVVVERDPRDTLLSMYRNMFEDGRHLYSYSLSDLGRLYRLFREIVAFWQERLPGVVHVIRYEDLLDDPEGETRKLLAHCDLEWEDACLSFHENRRRVDTLSLAQVRQPLYRSSVKAWQRYEDELGELFEALGDALPED